MFKALQNYFLKYPSYLVVRNKTKPPKVGKGALRTPEPGFTKQGKLSEAGEGYVTAWLSF